MVNRVYLVWETHQYEAWGLCAVFATEEAASACVQRLNDDERAEIMELRRITGSDNDNFRDRHVVDAVYLHETFEEWDAKCKEVSDGD